MRKLVAVFLLCLSGVFSFAQNSFTSLRGAITDPLGAVIPGARVVLTNEENGFVQSRVADAKGQYEFLQIPSGRYTVAVTEMGFAKQAKRAELLVNQPATLNFSLSVQPLATTLSVTSQTAVLNSTDATLGNAIGNATIQALPMEGRNVPDLLSLQPGVLYLGPGENANQTHDSRRGASAGARSDQGNLTLDGIDNNDQLRGYGFTGVLRSTLDSVQEFRVTTAGFNADTGRTSGAQISVVTRSGTNAIHGSLYEYNRNRRGTANDWFNKQAQLSQGLPNVPGQLIRNTYGVSLGGPIKKDRLFFFANYEGQHTAENKQQTMVVPGAFLRAGQIRYPSTIGGAKQVVSLTPADIASMDPQCAANGNCPWGPGVNPNVLAMFNQYPLPNGFVAGDGLNTGSYTWSAPNPAWLKTYIAKLDYLVSSRNRLFVRGNLQNDKISGAPQFPGQAASFVATHNSKGIAAGETWTVSDSVINSLHYGLTRQGYATRGMGEGQFVSFYGISPIVPQTRTTIVTVPVHHLVDDLSWIKDRHTFQIGANYRLVSNHRQSDALSYASAVTNSYALAQAGIANTGSSLDPAAFGLPAVDPDFADSYNFAAANLTGLLDFITYQYNYRISPDGKTATLLPSGTLVSRSFRNHEFEYYLQDSWRVRPNLTINYGVRHTLLQTPYEMHGQQVQPTADIHQWFRTRAQQAALGNSAQPFLSFAPSGQARGLQPYWSMQTHDIAPRIALAYAPDVENGFWGKLFGPGGKSTLRAGYGIYYDHFGQAIVNLFDQYGSFGIAESIVNPTNVLTPDTSPRFTGLHEIPQIVGAPPSTITYPVLAPADALCNDPSCVPGFAITHGLDNRIQTPYSHVVNLAFQRELPKGFVLEAAYLGRFGRRLLQQIDLAQPLNLVDAKSGQDYFSAAAQLSKLGYAGVTSVPAIPFFENMFPDAAVAGASATQNIYDHVWRHTLGNETASLYALDVLCYPGCGGQTGRFWPLQYASMYAWSSIGESNYNAGQFTLRHPMNHGLQVEFSYNYAKSMDMGSDTERTMYSSSTGSDLGTSFSAILNAWNPKLDYAPSDFDVTHAITADWVIELPLGQGKAIASGAGQYLNALLGGWQLSGLARWTSGLPFSVISGAGWGTNWLEKSSMVQTGPIVTGTHLNQNGSAQAFQNPADALANLRNPYPGEAGQRNNFRGDGYFGMDASLSKTWKIRESGSLRLAWEVFNVTNSVRFDVNPLTSLQNLTTSGQFGVYGATLTKPRVQQFSVRYSF